jgi:GNAT superfamily N-acetyltransferase
MPVVFLSPFSRTLRNESTHMLNETSIVIVRPVGPKDAVQLRENCFSANTLAEVEADIAERIQGLERGTLVHLVAEVAGIVVGTGILAKNEHLFRVHRGKVGSLVVHPDYQGRGIARRIVQEMHGYAASMGIEFLEIGCRGGTPAEKVYPRLGFIECGRFPRGLIEPWGEHLVFDEVLFYMPVQPSLAQRAKRGDRSKFERAMAKVADIEPEPRAKLSAERVHLPRS